VLRVLHFHCAVALDYLYCCIYIDFQVLTEQVGVVLMLLFGGYPLGILPSLVALPLQFLNVLLSFWMHAFQQHSSSLVCWQYYTGAVKCLLLHLGNYLCMNISAKIMSLCPDCALYVF